MRKARYEIILQPFISHQFQGCSMIRSFYYSWARNRKKTGVIALFMALKLTLRSKNVPLRNICYRNRVVQLLGFLRFDVLPMAKFEIMYLRDGLRVAW